MRKSSLVTLLLITPLLLVAFLGCGQDDIPNNPVPTFLEVTQQSPFSDEPFVSIGTSVVVTFTEDINPSTVNDSIFIFDPAIAGTVSYANRQITFTPIADFEFKTVYNVTLQNVVRDVQGRYMESELNWLFSTRSENPEVVSVIPAKNGQNIPINSTIEITFTKDLNESTISLDDLTIFPETPGVISYSDKKITFTPSSTLEYGTTYNIKVLRANLEDTSGYFLSANYSWGFTTTNVYPDGLLVPLKAGNYWSYTRNYYPDSGPVKVDTARLSIRSSTNVEYMDEEYDVFFWNWYNVSTNSPNPYYEYVRNNEFGLWWMGGVNTETDTVVNKVMWFKYPVNLNDTWDLNDSVSLECVALDDTLTTEVSVTPLECIVYRETTTFGAPPTLVGKIADLSSSYSLVVTDYYMVPNVGLVGYKVWGDGNMIYDAVVNIYVVD